MQLQSTHSNTKIHLHFPSTQRLQVLHPSAAMAVSTQPANFSYFLGTYPSMFQETVTNSIKINSTYDPLNGCWEILNLKMFANLDDSKIANIDEGSVDDPLLNCHDIAEELFDIFRRRECEIRPRPDYMTSVQKKKLITPMLRTRCVDWLVGISERIELKGETLHMAIGYLDRYLSKKAVETLMLGQVGIACLMLAAKYDEEDVPLGFNVFLNLTDDFITRKDLIDLEWSVWSTIGFNLTPPTAHHFLMRYLRAARGGGKRTVAVRELEHTAFFLAELALTSYDLLRFQPSKVAAAVVFLARYALAPARNPWSATLQRYSYYKAAELRNCVMALHRLWLGSKPWTEEIWKKYGKTEYGGVTLNTIPKSVPAEAFES